MPSSTNKRITYPVSADPYAATPAFSTLAQTTDRAIQESEASTLSAARTEMTAIAGDVSARVEKLIAGSALGNADDEAIQASVERVLASDAWKKRQLAYVHVADYGAVGDGTTDDTAAIQDAISTGRHVQFSNQTYRISDGFRVPSNTRISGNGAKLVSSRALASVFLVEGSPDAKEINLAGNYNAGDTTLKTTAPHGLEVGEVFRLVGQRSAGSIDAPPADRLGMSTSNSGYPWFGEYLKVRAVNSPTEIRVSTGLIFNGYRDNKSQETHALARARTTLNKMKWAKNVLIEGFRLDLSNLYMVRADYAMDCVFRDLREVRRRDQGVAFGSQGSFRCLVTDVHSEYPGDHPAGVEIYGRNTYKIMSSQAIWIDRCTADGGSQIVDMSYQRAAMIPTISCTVTRCTFWGYDKNAMTTHPGVWGAIIENNDFRAGNDGSPTMLASGIAVRSPYSVVRNNVVQGSKTVPAPANSGSGGSGISLFDGGGHHCQITGNVITGFDRGIAMTDGNEEPERHQFFYNQVTNNQITDCTYGIAVWKSSVPVDMTALMISGNQITSVLDGATGVTMGENGGSRAVSMIGNSLHFTGADPVPFDLGKAQYPVLMSNVVTGTATRLYTYDSAAVGVKLVNNLVVTATGTTTHHNV